MAYWAEASLQQACEFINSLPTVRAGGVFLTLQSDFHTFVEALDLATDYLRSIIDRPFKKQIREASALLAPYFEQFKNSDHNHQRIAINV